MRNPIILWATMLPAILAAAPSRASEPLRVEITEGVGDVLALAIPRVAAGFSIAGGDKNNDAGVDVANIIDNDLAGTGVFRIVPGKATNDITAWQRRGAQAMVTATMSITSNGDVLVQCTLTDVFENRIDLKKDIVAQKSQWRRAAHGCADLVFERTTGFPGHFDTLFAYVAKTSEMGVRANRLAITDFDGSRKVILSSSGNFVSMPRFSPDRRSIVYMNFVQDKWRLAIIDLSTGQSRDLVLPEGEVFGPRYSPDGKLVAFSLASDGNCDIYVADLASGKVRRLTNSAGVDTGPSFSPDGSRIVFESSRSGQQQLYVMNADGSKQERVSFGGSGYASPSWAPRGDLIAFSKATADGMQVGIMRPDGSRERILTSVGQNESPSWAPSGRAIVYSRCVEGEAVSGLWTTDLSGKIQRALPGISNGADPEWSSQQQ